MAHDSRKEKEEPQGAQPGAPEEAATEAAEEQHPILKWAQDHAKPLIAAVTVVILIAAGYAFVDYYQDRQFEKAKVELSRILTQTQGEQAAEELAEYAEDAPEPLRMSALLELAATYERLENYDAAAKTWDTVAAEAGNDFSIPARLGRPKSLARSGEIEKALAELDNLQQEAPESYSQIIKLSIASAAERAGDYQRALQAYKSIRQDTQGGQQAFIDYKIRQFERLMEQNGAS